MKTILVVDDEPKITQLVRDYLERAGFGVLVAYDGKKALSLAKTEKPDMVVLDLGLPQLDGLDFTREFRKASNAPIIMLTARAEESDKLIGLELGADDYLSKPFNPRELVARIRAVLRRAQPVGSTTSARETIRVGDIEMDSNTRNVRRSGEVVELTGVEYDLLEILLRNAGQIVKREDLVKEVLGRELSPFDRSIDMHVSNLRKKLGHQLNGLERIKTIRGVGYIYGASTEKSE
jgi:two-component system response regulator CpxR